MTTAITRTDIAPGIYYGVGFAEYASWRAYNPTTVKKLIDGSPLAMRHYIDHGGDDDTAAMRLGRASHVAVFEPDEFLRRYVLWAGTRRGKEWDAFCDANEGRDILRESEYELALSIRDAVRGHDSACELLSGGNAEVSIVWKDTTGLLCKGRIDWLFTGADGCRIVDLKTARDHRPFRFQRQYANLLYHVSVAAYCDGIKTLTGATASAHTIAVESSAPFDVIRYDLPGVTVRDGLKKWKSALQRIVWCEQNKTWPGYAAEPLTLELPEWALDQASL